MELARDSWLRAVIKTEQFTGSLQAAEPYITKQKKLNSIFFSSIIFPREMKSRLQVSFGQEEKGLVCLKFYFGFILSYQRWYIQTRPFSKKYCANESRQLNWGRAGILCTHKERQPVHNISSQSSGGTCKKQKARGSLVRGAEISSCEVAGYGLDDSVSMHAATSVLSSSSHEGNGTPLQYSCLENPMDGGAWWAADHGVIKSWTRLSDFTLTFTFMHRRRKWQPTPVFLPGESQGWGSLVGCRLWGHTESDTTEATQQQQLQLFVTPRAVACQAPLSMDSPGKMTGVGCQSLLQGIFPTQGLNHTSLMSAALAEGFFTTSATWEEICNFYFSSTPIWREGGQISTNQEKRFLPVCWAAEKHQIFTKGTTLIR